MGRSIPDEADPAAELVGVLTDPRDPDWTKLVEGSDIIDFMPWDRAEAGIIVVAMRELLCGENGELQNLTEDGHIRLCVLAVTLFFLRSSFLREDGLGLSQGSMLDVDAFVRIMRKNAWRHTKKGDSTGKPDTQADIRRWWSLMLPFDKAIHGQLLAAIGTKAKKRKIRKLSKPDRTD